MGCSCFGREITLPFLFLIFLFPLCPWRRRGRSEVIPLVGYKTLQSISFTGESLVRVSAYYYWLTLSHSLSSLSTVSLYISLFLFSLLSFYLQQCSLQAEESPATSNQSLSSEGDGLITKILLKYNNILLSFVVSIMLPYWLSLEWPGPSPFFSKITWELLAQEKDKRKKCPVPVVLSEGKTHKGDNDKWWGVSLSRRFWSYVRLPWVPRVSHDSRLI